MKLMFLYFYNLCITPVEQWDWLVLVWGRMSRFACLHQMHSCTFWTEAYLQMSSRVPILQPVNIFCQNKPSHRKINSWRKSASKTGLKRHNLLILRHYCPFSSCIETHNEQLHFECIITCLTGISFIDLAHRLDLIVDFNWFIFVFTTQMLHTLQMSLWSYSTVDYLFELFWTHERHLIQYSVLGPHYRIHFISLFRS